MRKFYVLLAATLFFGLQVTAQNHANPAKNLKGNVEDYIKVGDYVKPAANVKNKALESSWLSPVSNWESQGAFFQGSSFLRLFPDSNVVIVPSDGGDAYHNAWNLIGNVFQPEEPLYELQSGGWLINRFDTYTVDSVRFPIGYFRNADSVDVNGTMTEVVDTLVLHYYQPEHFQIWTLTSTGERFVLPNGDAYDAKTVGPNDVNFTDTLLLDGTVATPVGDDGTFSPRLVQTAIPAEFNTAGPNPQKNGSNVVGLSIVYKPGQSYNLGDTLVSFNENAENVKKLNNFGTITYFNDGGAMTQTEFLNNTFVTNRQVRYGQEFGSIKGYLPTFSFFGWQSDFFWDADYKVSVENPSSVSTLKDDLGLKAYPNPAAMGQEILVKLDKNVAIENVAIVMTDLLGNVVSSDFRSTGLNTFSLATDRLAGGVYLINVKAENSSSTIRVVLAD